MNHTFLFFTQSICVLQGRAFPRYGLHDDAVLPQHKAHQQNSPSVYNPATNVNFQIQTALILSHSNSLLIAAKHHPLRKSIFCKKLSPGELLSPLKGPLICISLQKDIQINRQYRLCFTSCSLMYDLLFP